MNQIDFIKILTNPSKIRKKDVKGLESIVDEFPYFQVGHFLHLSALKKQRSFKYNDCLKQTAAYTTDRAILFDYITSFNKDIHPAPADISTKKGKASSSEESGTEAISIEKALVTPDSESPEVTLKLGQPLEFNSDESYSFREWLQLSKYEPLDRSSEGITLEKKDTDPRADTLKKSVSNMDLIDSFIATNPKINPAVGDSYSNIAMESVTENESLMTETLAHVYVEQKKYKKAITAFTVLSLKYPEKSSFFASQIEAINKLQEK